METAQEGAWVFITSLSYPRRELPGMRVQWPPQARDGYGNAPIRTRVAVVLVGRGEEFRMEGHCHRYM